MAKSNLQQANKAVKQPTRKSSRLAGPGVPDDSSTAQKATDISAKSSTKLKRPRSESSTTGKSTVEAKRQKPGPPAESGTVAADKPRRRRDHAPPPPDLEGSDSSDPVEPEPEPLSHKQRGRLAASSGSRQRAQRDTTRQSSQPSMNTAIGHALNGDESDLEKSTEDEQDELDVKQSDEDAPSGDENPDEIAAAYHRERPIWITQEGTIEDTGTNTEARVSRRTGNRRSRRARSASSHGSDALGGLGLEDDDDGEADDDRAGPVDTQVRVIPNKHRSQGNTAAGSTTKTPKSGARRSDWASRAAELPTWRTQSIQPPPVQGAVADRQVTHPTRDRQHLLSKAAHRRGESGDRDRDSDDQARGELSQKRNRVVQIEADDVEHDDSIEIIYPTKGGDITLKSQRPLVRGILTAAIVKVKLDILFENAYPLALKTDGASSALLACARRAAGAEAMAARMMNDSDYLETLAAIPTQRVYNFRGEFKSKCSPMIQSKYECAEMGDAETTQEAIKWLKRELMYIYPCSAVKQTYTGNAPFEHPAIIAVLKQTLFETSSSFGWKHIDLCTSSLKDKPDERELPKPMLAIASTVVFSVLDDWSKGVYQKSNFEGKHCTDAYTRNIEFLSRIEKTSNRKYHVMMHKLFKLATGQATASRGNTVPDADLAALDLDNMPDE